MTRKLSGLVFAAAFAVAALFAQQPATPPATTQAAQPAQAQTTPPAPTKATAQPAAQPAGQAGQEAAPTIIRMNVNEVNLIFTVTDKNGHYIADLQQHDFALYDDRKAPAAVKSFHQQINLPLRVGIVIDSSTSIRQRFQFEQQSAIEFLLEILKARSDRAFVMDFAETPRIDQDWTNNIDALETGVNRMRPAGGTALYDAVYTACRDKLLTERGPEPFRKAMVLISDGNDNVSHVYQEETIKECQRAETIIYAISTNWTPSRGKGDEALTKMAEETGGQVFFPPSVEEMSTSFHSIEEELRSQYAIIYTPADFKYDGGYRKIVLRCVDGRFTARAKKGYFAPKQ
ncbi:MAG: VWA domain-containing protein [Terracidiphilus sp.]|jgi:VWFA-related protein